MKTTTPISIGATMAFLLSACGLIGVPGSGKIVTETRTVSGFSKIEFSVPGELILTQDGTEGLTIEGDDDLMQYILTEVQGDTLKIYVDPSVPYLVPTQTIYFRLNAKNVDALTVNGSGNARAEKIEGAQLDLKVRGSGTIEVDKATTGGDQSFTVDGSGKIQLEKASSKNATATINGSGKIQVEEASSENLTAAINGSGNITASIETGSIESRITGSGSIRLDGKAASFDAKINGSGSIRTQDLETGSITARIDGSGLMQLWATETLDVTINGSGSVKYRGRPKVSQHIYGSGDVRSIE